MTCCRRPSSEVKPQSLTEALAVPTGGKQLTLWGDVWRKLKRDKRFWVASGADRDLRADGDRAIPVPARRIRTCARSPTRALSPSKAHWFGTDILGCDYYTRVLYGARTSLEVG